MAAKLKRPSLNFRKNLAKIYIYLTSKVSESNLRKVLAEDILFQKAVAELVYNFLHSNIPTKASKIQLRRSIPLLENLILDSTSTAKDRASLLASFKSLETLKKLFKKFIIELNSKFSV